METILIAIVDTVGACQIYLLLAKALAQKGHRVVLAAPKALAEQASTLDGVEFRPLPLDVVQMTEQMKGKKMGILEVPAYILKVVKILFPTLYGTVKALQEIVEEVHPDKAISNHVFQFWFQHVCARIPTKAFVGGYIISDPVLARLGVSPNLFPQIKSPVRFILAPLLHALLLIVWELLFVPATWVLSCIAARKIVPYVPMLLSLLRCRKRIYAMFPITLGLKGTGPFYKTVKVVGPFLNEETEQLPAVVDSFMQSHANVALVTRSSLSGFPDKVAMIVDVLLHHNFGGIIFVGKNWKPAAFQHDNVLFVDYVHLQSLYRRGITFGITSAGAGTRNERLAFGIPGPYIPIPGEQWETAKDLFGLGLTSKPLVLEEMTSAELEKAVVDCIVNQEDVWRFAQDAPKDGLKQAVDWLVELSK